MGLLYRRQIRVLHIISGDLWAGAESMAFQLMIGLNRINDVDLHLIVLNEGRLERQCREAGINCYLIPEKNLSFIQIVLRSVKIVRRLNPNVIHSHRYKENIIAAITAAFNGRSKLVTTRHGRPEKVKELFHKRVISALDTACLRWIFSEIIAVSQDTAEYLIQMFGPNSKKISVIHNGIAPSFHPILHQSNSQRGSITIGSAGRLFPVKQFDVFIRIAKLVCQEKPEIRFVIAGEGPEREKIESLIIRYGLKDKIQLLGHLDDMQAFYKGIDLYINTSAHEGSPMTILEAMAVGLPVIAFSVAGLPEILSDGRDGFVIPDGNYEGFASRIIELTDDYKRLNVIGLHACRKVADRFSVVQMVNSYLAIYLRVN